MKMKDLTMIPRYQYAELAMAKKQAENMPDMSSEVAMGNVTGAMGVAM